MPQPPWFQKYGRDLVLAIVFTCLPWGYGETELIPRENIWHPIVGWVLWAFPVAIGIHMIWMWLGSKNQSRSRRTAVVIALTGAFLFLATSSVKAFVGRQMQQEQNDVFEKLSARVELPAAGDVMNGFFVLSNGSKTRIAEAGSCVIHAIVGTHAALSGFTSIGFPSGGSLGPGGEAQSFQCLKPAVPQLVGVVVCADVELLVNYSLESQAAVKKEKYFRFTGYRDADQFIFVPQPSSGATNNEPNGSQYCGKYLPRPHPASP